MSINMKLTFDRVVYGCRFNRFRGWTVVHSKNIDLNFVFEYLKVSNACNYKMFLKKTFEIFEKMHRFFFLFILGILSSPVTAWIVARHELSPATIHADARGINRRRRQFMLMFTAWNVACMNCRRHELSPGDNSCGCSRHKSSLEVFAFRLVNKRSVVSVNYIY